MPNRDLIVYTDGSLCNTHKAVSLYRCGLSWLLRAGGSLYRILRTVGDHIR